MINATGTIVRAGGLVAVEGDVSVRNAHELKQAIIDGIKYLNDHEIPGPVYVDLAEAKAIDSSGIAALASGARHAAAHERSLVIQHPTTEFVDVLHQMQREALGVRFEIRGERA